MAYRLSISNQNSVKALKTTSHVIISYSNNSRDRSSCAYPARLTTGLQPDTIFKEDLNVLFFCGLTDNALFHINYSAM